MIHHCFDFWLCVCVVCRHSKHCLWTYQLSPSSGTNCTTCGLKQRGPSDSGIKCSFPKYHPAMLSAMWCILLSKFSWHFSSSLGARSSPNFQQLLAAQRAQRQQPRYQQEPTEIFTKQKLQVRAKSLTETDKMDVNLDNILIFLVPTGSR